MKLWDTETGQCLQRFSNGKIPYVVRFHPDEDKQHIFLAGMSDKKIIQVYTSVRFTVYVAANTLNSMISTAVISPRNMTNI